MAFKFEFSDGKNHTDSFSNNNLYCYKISERIYNKNFIKVNLPSLILGGAIENVIDSTFMV